MWYTGSGRDALKNVSFTKGTHIETGKADELFLVIDQGGHASRVTVFDARGTEQVCVVRPVSVRHPQQGWVEQDADEIERSVRSAITEVAEQLGERCRLISTAGLATQRSNIVCWDRQTGEALSPAISWQDRRAHQWMQPFEKQRPQIRELTGLLPSPHYGVSKIHWCLENLPKVSAAHRRGSLACGPLASFLLFRLLTENPLMVDAVNASRTLLWDWRQRDWSAVLLETFGLTSDYLPQGVANRYTFGKLVIANISIPLTVCTGDQSAALFASGKPEQGIAYINIGTGAFMQCVMTSENAETGNSTQANLLRSVVWDSGEDSAQVLEATVNGAGSALLVVAEELGIPAENAQNHYAQWLVSEKNIPVFLNGVSGLGSPFWLSQFDSKFVGPNAGNSRPPQKIVAVLESIVFLLCLNLEEMLHAGIALKSITVSGGLSVLDGLCQRLSDVSQLPVERALQTEATAEGMAFLLIEAEIAWTKVGKVSHFEPQDNHALAGRYQYWMKAMLAAVEDVNEMLKKTNKK